MKNTMILSVIALAFSSVLVASDAPQQVLRLFSSKDPQVCFDLAIVGNGSQERVYSAKLKKASDSKKIGLKAQVMEGGCVSTFFLQTQNDLESLINNPENEFMKAL